MNYFFLLSDGSYGDPETILDENELLERYSHVDITKIKMSPSGKVGIFLDPFFVISLRDYDQHA